MSQTKSKIIVRSICAAVFSGLALKAVHMEHESEREEQRTCVRAFELTQWSQENTQHMVRYNDDQRLWMLPKHQERYERETGRKLPECIMYPANN